MSITVVLPKNEYSVSLGAALLPLLPPGSRWADPDDSLEDLQGARLLFAVALDEGGMNLSCCQMISRLRREDGLLEGCLGAVVVVGRGELYTKDVARDLVLAANLAGCAFLGRPLVEATGDLRNFYVQASIYRTDERTAFRMAVQELTWRLVRFEPLPPARRFLVLHASLRATSNTLALWDLVKRGLPGEAEVTELCLRGDTLADCAGCSYTACLHFGQQGGCFYGGPMVEEVFPAVRACDALVML